MVILVLGVLLAIALPLLLNSQDSAKDASAKSSLNTAYKAAKIISAQKGGAFTNGSYSLSQLAQDINSAEPGIDVSTGTRQSDGKIYVSQPSGSSSDQDLNLETESGSGNICTAVVSGLALVSLTCTDGTNNSNNGGGGASAPNRATTASWSLFDGNHYLVQSSTRGAASNSFGAATTISNPGQDATSPHMDVAADGTVTAVWLVDTGGSSAVQTATRQPGQNSFGTVETLSGPGEDVSLADVVVAPDGATTVIWVSGAGSNNSITARTRPPGSSTFGAAEVLAQSSAYFFGASAAITPSGMVTVAWSRRTSSSLGSAIVEARTRPAGSNTFGAAEALSAPGDNRGWVVANAGSNGDVIVSWRLLEGQGASSTQTMRAAVRPSGASSFAAAENVYVSPGAAEVYNNQAVIAPDGAITLVWELWDGPNLLIKSATRNASSGSFASAVTLSSPGTNTQSPSTVVSSGGAVSVAWQAEVGGGNPVAQIITRAAGSGSFGAPETLSTGAESAFQPRASIGADGAITVVWMAWDGSDGVVKEATRLASSGSFSSPQTLSSSSQDISGHEVVFAP